MTVPETSKNNTDLVVSCLVDKKTLEKMFEFMSKSLIFPSSDLRRILGQLSGPVLLELKKVNLPKDMNL